MIRWKFNVEFLWFVVHLVSIALSSEGADVRYKGKTVVQLGKPFTIECRISVFDYPKWTKDGYAIEQGNGLHLSERRDGKSHVILTLHVNETKESHAGYYRCNSFSREAHKISILFLDPEEDYDFSDEDESDDTKSSVILKVNQTVKVYCDLPKDETFPVLWFKDNYRLLSGKNPNLVIKDRFLTIKKATEKDAGEYMCTSTDVNTLSRPAVSSPNDVIGHITSVKYPAEVEPLPQRRLKEGDDLILECKVHGSPVPRVKWLIGNIDPEILGNLMSGYENLELLENENGLPNAILYLPNITANQQGLFTCKAENSLKIDEASVFVTVLDNSIQTNEKEPGSGIILEPNKPLVLQCNLTETNLDGVVELRWKKDNVIVNDNEITRYVASNHSLVINHPNENNHTGLYTCIFAQPDGEPYTNTTIDVSTRPTVEQFHKSLNLVQGDRLTLNCKYGGIPSPDIKWLKDLMDINTTDTRISITTDKETKVSTLKIDNLDYPDRAEYTCQVSMKEDVANTTILVRVKDRLAALWPFLGIVAEVAILCTIIFVYEKKRAKPEFDDADTDHTADKKNIQDQKEGHDVRQRK